MYSWKGSEFVLECFGCDPFGVIGNARCPPNLAANFPWRPSGKTRLRTVAEVLINCYARRKLRLVVNSSPSGILVEVLGSGGLSVGKEMKTRKDQKNQILQKLHIIFRRSGILPPPAGALRVFLGGRCL